ncbi:tRNA (adenosine(37)-N6)-dimethylallyltransferase MiaA [Lachnoanaerobaculum sp. JCM 36186]|uniref:tRNA (adenosine(37)-N6)-dimethylallyltransferase MiaA n=1 Tax=Lachnoanaerobaculum sanguinis TaxID=3065809 RepID=UPI00276F73EE|nr:tRNA (adenosine(37)-N6)-dimethylallyltransferase MiaA [Lachnoanaerobaculum sp. JCM 36186]GMO03294.1 tRNA (adenosine(37)-N6)-dimethylallyltransferase MiaA [Lachnoanaerobaculum sp. JCM 36186]
MTKNKLIILAGPTASGKTSVSIDLAKRLGGEIISADSMQVYKYMDVGTAKISVEEMQGVKHHLIDVLNPKEDFNIVKFQNMVKCSIEEIVKNGHIPILVGGTGFYIQSVIYDIDFNNEDDNSSVRKKLEEEYDAFGADFMHEKLKKIDIVSAQTIHKNNKKRIIRAIEYFLINNEPISSHNEVQREKKSPYDYRFFVLNPPRDILYERINKRVDIMVENGLVDEVKKLREMGLSTANISMQGIGYKEIIEYLDGEVSLETAIENIKQNTRHMAKRQVTWFKREKDVIYVDPFSFESNDKIVDYMIEKINTERIDNE